MVNFFRKKHFENEHSFTKGYLTGQVLVASPFMEDSRFYQTVIYICGHDVNGAMGFILNKPLPSIMLNDLLDQLEIEHPSSSSHNVPIYYGGPVEVGRGFVMHGREYSQEATVKVNDEFAITATLEILRQISAGHGPSHSILLLGYTGWAAGQLEKELTENQWVLLRGTPEFVFEHSTSEMWGDAYQKLGIDPHLFSMDSGHA